MEVLYTRCAGLDVHQRTVTACLRVVENHEVRQEVRTFATTMAGLLALSDWMTSERCTHVAMESTGVYWKPVWYVLEGSFELVLANAAHIRNMPGRKTAVSDAMWIADLLTHGLLRGSFVPRTAIQELRDLTRTRKQLVRERARHVRRIQKTLESANLKLTSVLTDAMGVSGRAVLEALIAGETDAGRLAGLLRGAIKASGEERLEALRGRILRAPPLPAAAASGAGRCVERRGGPRAGERDRSGHVPLPQRRASDLVGGTMPPQRRACRSTRVAVALFGAEHVIGRGDDGGGDASARSTGWSATSSASECKSTSAPQLEEQGGSLLGSSTRRQGHGPRPGSRGRRGAVRAVGWSWSGPGGRGTWDRDHDTRLHREACSRPR